MTQPVEKVLYKLISKEKILLHHPVFASTMQTVTALSTTRRKRIQTANSAEGEENYPKTERDDIMLHIEVIPHEFRDAFLKRGAEMADSVGQQLGSYRLIRLLGRGGFAEVYLGEHVRLKTQAAIKVLHTSLEGEDVEGFLHEAQTVARLKHPHIVRVFDFDVEEHIPFLIMDYLPNGNVRRAYPKGTSLSLDTIVAYVRQVASALQYAHDEKLIHRDVKPENMLLDRGNTLVLSDFGIALIAQSSRYQSTQEVAGTAAYMAPEQFQGKPRRASDQYALGVVVYEWLTGDRPFHGSFSEIASQHLFVSPPPFHEKVPAISPTVEQVVLKALAKDPKQRFASVELFAAELERAYLKQQTITVTPSLKHAASTQTRSSWSVALVLDCSSSLKENALKKMKRAVEMLIDRLEPSDYISVIAFAQNADVLIPCTPANDPIGVKAKIERLHTLNSEAKTSLSLGMAQGLAEFQRCNAPTMVRKMVLLTDGVTNEDTDRCCQVAREAAAASISIHSFGIGPDWNVYLLDDIGQASGGKPTEFMKDPADVLSIFYS